MSNVESEENPDGILSGDKHAELKCALAELKPDKLIEVVKHARLAKKQTTNHKYDHAATAIRPRCNLADSLSKIRNLVSRTNNL